MSHIRYDQEKAFKSIDKTISDATSLHISNTIVSSVFMNVYRETERPIELFKNPVEGHRFWYFPKESKEGLLAFEAFRQGIIRREKRSELLCNLLK